MFGSGKGHAEYKGLAASWGFKALNTLAFAKTRFTSSSYEQWEKIYGSYKVLFQTFIQTCEDLPNENEETKYQVEYIKCII